MNPEIEARSGSDSLEVPTPPSSPGWQHSNIALIRSTSVALGQFIYVTCFVIINQLVLWDPPVNYYSISRRQGSTFNPRHSVSRHQLSGTLRLRLQKVPLPSPLSRHIWKLNCSLLHTTRSNISSAAGTSDSNSQHTVLPINVFDIWHL